jgi:putative redox protein
VVDIFLEYEGDLHCTATHGPSSAVLTTDAPLDNHGRGASFSPTDLVATGLGSCMATVMGILAQKRGQALEGMRIHVKKQMTANLPRRIARLSVEVKMPRAASANIDDQGRAALEREAHQCPVRLSLLDAIDVPVVFDWPNSP